MLEQLNCKESHEAHATAVSYDTDGAIETPPALTAGQESYTHWRWAEVVAIDGDLLVKTATTSSGLSLDSGNSRVFSGTSRYFQLPGSSAVVGVAAAAGSVNGAVIFWR